MMNEIDRYNERLTVFVRGCDHTFEGYLQVVHMIYAGDAPEYLDHLYEHYGADWLAAREAAEEWASLEETAEMNLALAARRVY